MFKQLLNIVVLSMN